MSSKKEDILYSMSKKIYLNRCYPNSEIREKILIAVNDSLLPGVIYPNVEKLVITDNGMPTAELPNLKTVELVGTFGEIIKILERYPTITDIKNADWCQKN